jgi:hypothetical protein
MNRLHVFLLLLVATTSLGSKLDRLSDAEYAHYRALRIFMEEKDRKGWLRLKTQEARDQRLQDLGLWDKFYNLSESQRERVVSGEVVVGFTRDMLYMAWGSPYQKQRLTGRNAARSELLIYRFEIDKNGLATPVVGDRIDYKAVGQHQTELYVDDDVVTSMVEKDSWE